VLNGLTPSPLAVVFAAAVGMLAGWFFNRMAGLRLSREVKELRAELTRSEAQTREQSRQASRMRSEQRTFTSFVRQLPHAVQQLNRDNLNPRQIPRLIIQLAESIFEPEQILLYLAGPSNGGGRTLQQLHLAAHKGLGDSAESVGVVPFGEGKIGWAAENQMDMTMEDWLNPTRTEGRKPAHNYPGLRLDLIGPLLHHGESSTETLGVLCLGGLSSRLRDEKLMLQMVTNLGSIALMHSRNIRSLRAQAHHDGLTGLMNKRGFMVELGKMIFSAENATQSLGVFIFDIDYFKRYNDTNGHLAGDELLKDLAGVVRGCLRQGDVACRYGGEEFVVAMPDVDAEGAMCCAERVRSAVESYRFPHEESQPGGRLTISGGVAEFPHDGTNGTELLSHADQALYRAKGAGRNRVVRFRGVTIGGRQDERDADPLQSGRLGDGSMPGAIPS